MISKYGQNHFQEKTGLPLSPYFSVTKMKWLIENVPEVKVEQKKRNMKEEKSKKDEDLNLLLSFPFSYSFNQATIDAGDCLFGTVDSWLLWNMTGGKKNNNKENQNKNKSQEEEKGEEKKEKSFFVSKIFSAFKKPFFCNFSIV